MLLFITYGGLHNVAQVAGVHIEQLTYGVWFMAAIVAYLIIPKPGIALIAEFALVVKQLLWVNLISLQLYTCILQGLALKLFLLFSNINLDH